MKCKRPGAPALLAWALLAFFSQPARARKPALDAARLVPAGADAALLLDGADALAGPRAFLSAAGKLAPMLEPKRLLRDAIGVDLLAPPAEQDTFAPPGGARLRWGTLPSGPRALVVLGRAVGLSLPVAQPDAARKAVRAWLADGRRLRLRGRSERAAAVARVAGRDRLLLAAGQGAQKLLASLTALGRKRRTLAGNAVVARELALAEGPAVLWLRGEEPLLAAVLSLSGASDRFSVRGIVLPTRSAPLLQGPPASASACEGGPLLCARAGLGAAGRQLFALAARRWALLVLPPAQAELVAQLAGRAADSMTGPAAARVEALAVERLGSSSDPLWALPFTTSALQHGFSLPRGQRLPAGVEQDGASLTLAAPRPVCFGGDAAALWLGDDCARAAPVLAAADGEVESVATLDTPGLWRALSHAGPLDALRGQLAAGAYTAKLLFGRLLAASGAITLRARPDAERPEAARVELRWPLIR